MVERESPLGAAYAPGAHGDRTAGSRVRLMERRLASLVEAAAWPGREPALVAAIAKATGLALSPAPGAGALGPDGRAAFNVAPGRFTISAAGADLTAKIAEAVPLETGTVNDLSHGRTCLRIEGPRAEWVLAKLFALDFSPPAFPVPSGLASAHHDIPAQIQRTGPERFDLYVFRSFARAFWTALCRAAEEVGYTVE